MSETVLLIGNGSREHALAWKLAQSAKVAKVIVCPGNGGTKKKGQRDSKITNIPLDTKNLDSIVAWCLREKPSLVVIGPEDPLNRGLSDSLQSHGIPCFGPSRSAAQIECDKAYAKEFMERYQIPTARYQIFTTSSEAKDYVESSSHKPWVVKAAGLASGKGVLVGSSGEETLRNIERVLDGKIFGDAGDSIVVEDLLEGDEISVLCFSDGTNVSLMPIAQDHKRAHEKDEGPNTGGMGAFCPYYIPETVKEELGYIMKRAIDGLRSENRLFVGVLFAGFMLTEDGPKVLEFNARFGDPETQSILPLLDSDLYDILMACVQGKLSTAEIKWKQQVYSCGVVVASGGYPVFPSSGKTISGIAEAIAKYCLVFHGGTKENEDGQLITSSGRVLTVVALDPGPRRAIERAIHGASLIKIEDSFYRKDIGQRALKHLEASNQLISYRSSGVDIDAGNKLVERIKSMAHETLRPGVVGSIGGFGGLFDIGRAGYQNPLLVAGTDGVGTKLRIAIESNILNTVGVDLVAMCVNDILVQGAEPLFFLDYFACGKLDVDSASQVISGVVRGCKMAGCALIGGETAEMPGMYRGDDFDLAGFAVGAVGWKSVLPKLDCIEEGDMIIGLPSTGVHSNGFSLVRKIMKLRGLSPRDPAPFDETRSLGEILLSPTKIYVKSVLPAIRLGYISAASHITGGGLLENIPRVLPSHLAVEMYGERWKMPAVFKWIKDEGKILEEEMLRTFNCGLGMICVVKESNLRNTLKLLRENGEPEAVVVGKVVPRTENAVIVKNFESLFLKPDPPLFPKKRVAVLVSGSGTNLQALIDHTKDIHRESFGQIHLVISNKDGVAGLERAKKAGIKTMVISSKGYKNRVDYDMVVHRALREANIDIVCLAGFMRILSEDFVRLWRGQLINIHPSLLPLFKGMDTHARALAAGVRVHGCTVHFVEPEVDTGAIILQEAVPVFLDDTPEVLQERVKHSEHRIYPLALEHLVTGRVQLTSDGKVRWIHH